MHIYINFSLYNYISSFSCIPLNSNQYVYQEQMYL